MDANAHAACAALLESKGRAEDALQAWKNALQSDPDMEAAHYGVAHILLDRGDYAGAAIAAGEGLKAAPKSARLYLVRAIAQEEQNQWHDARRTMARGVAAVEDLALLRHDAELEDQYGRSAAHAYEALADVLGKSQAASGEYRKALERGRVVSLRSGDLKQAEWFEGRLKQDGILESSMLSGAAPKESRDLIVIPGGIQPLLLVAHGNEQTTPDRFFLDYCRTILGTVTTRDLQAAQVNLVPIASHFKRTADLEARGERDGDRVVFTLSVKDSAARRATEEILHLLGWEIIYSEQGVEVEPAEKGPAWCNRDVARTLGVDQLAMQEALQAGKSFRFEITDDRVPVLLGEAAWRNSLYPNHGFPGGLAEAVAHDPRIAKVYVGLSALDGDTSSILIKALGLETLALKYDDLIFWYSSALAVRKGSVVVPGGADAESIWEWMVGVSPRDPGRFFAELLRKDEGRLLAYYFALSELDSRHQRFFTRRAERTASFYRLFRKAPDMRGGAGRTWRNTPFIDFLAEVPIDDEGKVRFPGSPQVWMLAKGQSDFRTDSDGKLRKLSKIASPEVEDQILLRLANTTYRVGGYERSELRNFLAVVHLDAHRTTPLKDDAALILAEQFDRYEAAWPYFAVLTGLGRGEFERFFALGERLLHRDDVELNRIAGQLHSLLKLICIAKQAGRIDERQSTELFDLLCERFTAADTARDFTAASLDFLRSLIAKAQPEEPAADPDEFVENVLLGLAAEVSLDLQDAVYTLNGGNSRREDYRRVLELQKVPSLGALFRIYDAAKSPAGSEGDLRDSVQLLEKSVVSISNVDVPATLNVSRKEAGCLRSFRTGRLTDLVRELGGLTAAPKIDPRALSKVTNELLDALNPQVELALAGVIYAGYLNSSDLLISEDPLFLRRHEFIDLDSAARRTTIFAAPLLVQRQVEGSYLRGGFADFSVQAGETALAGLRMEDAKSYLFAAMQLGFLRATRWDLLDDDDLRLLGLKIRAAREWIVRSAMDPELLSDLSEASAGILSLTRRSDLLRSLESRDWENVWKVVTLSDLFFLADEYLDRYKADSWDSPTLKALRALSSRYNGARLQWMGPGPGQLLNCGGTHLVKLPPYEHFEKFLLPDKLAVRAAELKLYMGEYLDRRGLPAAALETIAEPLAMEILRVVRLTDLRDWHAMLAAYSGIDDKMIKGALPRR